MVEDKQSANRHGGNPDPDNYSRCNSRTRSRLCDCSRVAVFSQDLGWNQSDGQQNAQGYQDQIIQVSQDRNEIGNEINWRKRITSNQETHCLGVPRHARVSACEIKRMHILLDAARPILQPFNHCSTIMILVTLGGSRAVCNSRWSRAKRSATLSTGLVASELHDGLI